MELYHTIKKNKISDAFMIFFPKIIRLITSKTLNFSGDTFYNESDQCF